jgi:catecholate siderophore receptor
MLFGRGSTGGVINQVTKKPSLKEASEVQVMASSNGLVRTLLDHNRPLSETSAFRIAVMAQEGNATDRDQTKLKDYGIAPSLKLGIGEPTTITLSALLQHNNDQIDYGVPNLNGAPAAVDRTTAYGFNNDRTISDIASFGAVLEHKLSATSSLRNQTQLNSVTTDARETAPQGIGTIGGGGAYVPLSTGTTANPIAASSTLPLSQLWVRQQSHDRVIHDDSIFNITEFNGDYQWGSTKHALLAGLELGQDYYNNQNSYRNGSCNGIALNPVGGTSGYVACTPLLTPSGGDSPANAPSVNGNLATGRSTTVAVFGNDTLELNPQFKLVGGLRWDQFAASISNSAPTATTPAEASQTVYYTSVRAGGIWQPTAVQSYYLSYSTSFNPSLEQLVNTTGGTQPLPPQENLAYEAGGKWDVNEGKLSLTAAAFQITQYNARSQDSVGVYTATGTVRVNGMRAGIAGYATEKLQFFGGYTHLDASIVDGIAPATAGKTPANTPSDSAALWSTYALTPQWELGGGVTYTSQRYATNTNLVSVPSYVRWDATLAYHQPKYDIRLNLFNLSNAYYYDALIPSDGGRAVPGAARSAMLSYAYRF